MQLGNLMPVIEEICREKDLPQEKVIEAIESALATAYRRDFGQKNQNIKVEFDLKTGTIKVFDVKTVVADPEEVKTSTDSERKKRDVIPEASLAVQPEINKGPEKLEEKKFNPKKEITLSEAKKIKKNVKVGEEIKRELEIPTSFGRVAAQAAKQVIIQKLREAEKEVIYQEFKAQEGKIVSGLIQRKEKNNVFVDLDKVTAILPLSEQIKGEKYLPGQRIKVYISEVKKGTRSPEVIVSRAHPDILSELFRTEVPEVANRVVEIKAIAREAGSRSKVAVWTTEKGIDPIGSCIGQRGSRIQTIIAELGGEKIDIIEYTDNPIKFVTNALAPAKISEAKIIDEEKKIIAVKVKPDQLSLAIGRAGQNVRLAAKLTGW
ncbi:MAG: transcription termination factor NusA, partial [Patescibacteria group bacterium]|nr:transcription termination factor NusA [Patescibacteria group bacterium]